MKNTLSSNADFNINFEAAHIGAQGPDLFFFHRVFPIIMPGKPLNKIGIALHHSKPAEIFEAFAEYCKFSPNIDIAKSYIYGFILHYSLDRCCHPYVYATQEKVLEQKKIHPSSAHNEVEMAIDTYLLAKKLDFDNTRDFDSSSKITTNQEVVDEIAHLLAFVISRVTTYSPSEKTVKTAIADMRTSLKVLRNEHYQATILAKIVDALIDAVSGHYKFYSMVRPKDLEKAKEYANIEHGTWVSPYSKEASNCSFEDLYDSAFKDAEKLISDFEQLCKGYSNGYEITNNISFLTGIEVK